MQGNDPPAKPAKAGRRPAAPSAWRSARLRDAGPAVYAAFMPDVRIPHRALMRLRSRSDAPATTERPMLDILYIVLAAGFFLGAAASVRLLERL
ncbi:MAG: hypothetical protein KF914_03465 [Rhizobiaceae bacterium]|nr:hypothetical protein [Rhizobiaceae bacterium]